MERRRGELSKKGVSLRKKGRQPVEITKVNVDGHLVDGKECSKCGLVKPLEDFYKDKTKLIGRMSQCKNCKEGRIVLPNKHHKNENLRTNARKWSNEIFDSELSKIKPGWKRIGDVLDCRRSVDVVCDKGHETTLRPVHIDKNGCKYCYYESQVKEWDNQYFDEFLSRMRPGWRRVGNLEDKNYPVEVECSNGHRSLIVPRSLRAKNKDCQICKLKWTNEYFDNVLSEHRPGWKRLSDIKNAKSNVVVKCDKGHVTTKKAWDITKTGCNICTFPPWDNDRFDSLLPEGWERKSDVVNAIRHVITVCPNDHESLTRPSDLYSNKMGCRECANERKRDPNITEEERQIKRMYPQYFKWRREVYERDDYICQCCGSFGNGNLNAHHLDGYNWCKEKRTDVDNGVTLCDECHTDFHSKYGYGDNTHQQYEEWLPKRKEELNEIGNRSTEFSNESALMVKDSQTIRNGLFRAVRRNGGIYDMTKDSMIAVLKSQIDAARTALSIADIHDRYAVGLHTGIITALENALTMAKNLEVDKRYADV